MMTANYMAYCPYCKKTVNTSNAISFSGIEYNETPIRFCEFCANTFFDSARGEPAINYYNAPPPAPKEAGWGWVYIFFFAIPGAVYLANRIWLPGAILFTFAAIILLIKLKRWNGNSAKRRRTELASIKGLPSDVALSLKRMQNLEYIKILKELNVRIPEWFTQQQ